MKTRIPELRRERKLSQEELARAVGTTRQTITSIEVGRYTASLPLAYKNRPLFWTDHRRGIRLFRAGRRGAPWKSINRD